MQRAVSPSSTHMGVAGEQPVESSGEQTTQRVSLPSRSQTGVAPVQPSCVFTSHTVHALAMQTGALDEQSPCSTHCTQRFGEDSNVVRQTGSCAGHCASL